MRHAAQCVGRAIRGKTDYGIMVFADKVGNCGLFDRRHLHHGKTSSSVRVSADRVVNWVVGCEGLC